MASGDRDDGSWTPSDYRGGSGDVRDSYKIPQGEESQARYEKELDDESASRHESVVDRIKHWLSAHF